MNSGEFASTAEQRLLRSNGDFESLRLGDTWRVQTVNLHHLTLANADGSFADALATATWLTADGWPVQLLLASAGISTRRVTGSEWLERALQSRRFEGLRIGLLGGSQEAAQRLARRIGQPLVFGEHGVKEEWDVGDVLLRLRKSETQVLLVAVTPPSGDTFAAKLQAEGFRGSIIAVGGGLDMAVGLQPRAPEVARKMNVEWAFRLASNPRRLWTRYVLECTPYFFRQIVPQVAKNKLRRPKHEI